MTRPLGEGEFCLFGPMSTPHVVIQQTLSAGECREVVADLRKVVLAADSTYALASNFEPPNVLTPRFGIVVRPWQRCSIAP